MHKEAKEKLIEFIKEFKVYSQTIPVLPIYNKEKEDKLFALHKCVISTQKNLDQNFTREELGHFIADRVGDKLQDKYKKSSEQEQYEELTKLLSDIEIDEIINNIEIEIAKLPIQYKIYFSLGIANTAFEKMSMQIDDNLLLKGVDRTTLPSEGFNGISPLQAAIYASGKNEVKEGNTLAIELSFSGYVDKFAMTPPLENAVNKIKVFIALMLIFNILKIDFYKYISFYFQKSLFIFDDETKFIRTVELEHDLSESLHRLNLHESALKPGLIGMLGRKTPPTESENFQESFTPIIKYFEFIVKAGKSTRDRTYAKRLEDILTWYLTGISSNNKSVGFISLIFAFESLFMIVNTEKGEQISTGLAGRCAYFISNDFKEREEIIAHIDKIYKLRSDIAHDGKRIATYEELDLFVRLLSLLQFSLNKEIRNIKI